MRVKYDNMTDTNNRGFTLMELLVVVAIVGILAALAGTAYVGTMRKAARMEAYSNLQNLRLLEEQFFAENARYTIALGVAGSDKLGNVAIIQNGGGDNTNALPAFRPGNTGLNFSYQILQNFQINVPVTNPPTWAASAVNTQCFTAVARGNSNTRVTGDTFAIDCNNIRNFE